MNSLKISHHKPLISIIIVTYNSVDLLGDCLSSVIQFMDIDEKLIEVIIVDNSNTFIQEKTRKILFDHQLYQKLSVKFIPNTQNTGYGSGNNLGVKNSSGEIICIMNPDIRLSEPIFSEAISEFRNNSHLKLLSFKQIGGKNLSFYFKPEFQIPILSDAIIKLLNRFNLFYTSIHFLSGAFFFIEKNKFLSIGGFDENIFLYFEEPDIAKKLKNNEIKYNFKKKYIHLIGNRTEINIKTWETEIDSLVYYCSKYNINKKRIYYFWQINFLFKFLISKFLLKENLRNLFFEKYKLMKVNKIKFYQ